ncbi:MAG: hypothetical protein JXR31_09465 [Prolixibacteraceae bacterium]|nr:hypothetical protein [Prolixibacteraceae bacterium]MBN2774462.1 hypothetical protein [Prolixibacteraceae bacterium]
MNKFGTLFIVILFSFSVLAIENPKGGARSLAMSNAFISITDIWGTFHNQAGIAELQNISVSVYYTSKFNLKELSQISGTAVLPTKSGNFGFCFSQFGTGQFKETKLGLAFSKQLGEKIFTGIQIDYLSSLFPENSRARGVPTFEGGLIYKINEKWRLGAHIFNPLHVKFKSFSGEEKMPFIIRAGSSFNISETFLFSAEIEKVTELKVLIKSGAEFFVAENFVLRFGVSGEPFAYTSGIGYTFGKITTDIAFHYHGNLGLTPAISIQFNLK